MGAPLGLVLITHGESVEHIGDVPDSMREEMRQATSSTEVPAVGFIHSGLGVFWLNIWTWDGRYCLYSGNTVWELEPEQAADILGISISQLSKPVLYSFPPGLLILVGIATLWAGFSWREQSRVKALTEDVNELMQDSRYQRALEVLQDHQTHENEPSTDPEMQGVNDVGEHEPPVSQYVRHWWKRLNAGGPRVNTTNQCPAVETQNTWTNALSDQLSHINQGAQLASLIRKILLEDPVIPTTALHVSPFPFSVL